PTSDSPVSSCSRSRRTNALCEWQRQVAFGGKGSFGRTVWSRAGASTTSSSRCSRAISKASRAPNSYPLLRSGTHSVLNLLERALRDGLLTDRTHVRYNDVPWSELSKPSPNDRPVAVL